MKAVLGILVIGEYAIPCYITLIFVICDIFSYFTLILRYHAYFDFHLFTLIYHDNGYVCIKGLFPLFLFN